MADSAVIGARPGRVPAPGVLRETTAFGSNPGALRMWSYAPAALEAGAPLVVVLHGCGQSAADYAVGAGWISLAGRLGFAVLCPEQVRSNNLGRCFNWFEPKDIRREGGEAESIRQMVGHALSAHDLDPSRVFVTGLSAGGAMALAMLAAYPEVFVGGGVVAGLAVGVASGVREGMKAMAKGAPPERLEAGVVGAGSTHAGPWPRLSVWHGSADTVVAPANARQIVQQWLRLHGVEAAPSRGQLRQGHSREAWAGAGGEVVVELHLIDGLGHGAPLAATGPDGHGKAGPFLLEAGISSALGMATFWGLSGEDDVEAEVVPSPGPEPRTVAVDVAEAAVAEPGPASEPPVGTPIQAAPSLPEAALGEAAIPDGTPADETRADECLADETLADGPEPAFAPPPAAGILPPPAKPKGALRRMLVKALKAVRLMR